ncbi:MAG: hypothetical protein EOP83_17695 [Verrucomicrobiaceae bacterium]|nr:MAG: hypothetical protein EOP83_17695 [Verrucomicrobiaceae bacterium]
MTVEDAIEVLAHHVNRGLFTITHEDSWAFKFVQNVSAYTRQDKPLSTEQSRIILRVVRKNRAYLIEHGTDAEAIDALLAKPTYRNEPYPSANVPREVRHLGDNLLGFRFKRNDEISQALQALMAYRPFKLDNIWFHRDHRLWVVPITRWNLTDAMNVIRDHRFGFDEGVTEYLTACENNRGRPAEFIGDASMGIIAGQVYDCEIIAWWARNVVGGSLA